MSISFDIGSFFLGLATAIVIPFVLWLMRRHERVEESKRQQYAELAEAFDIHAALTDPIAMDALEKVEGDQKSRRFLVSLHERSSYRFNAFSEDFSIPEDVEKIIRAELERIADALPAETAAAQNAFDEKARRTQNHQKDETVLSRVLELATHLVGSKISRGETLPVETQFEDLFHTVRVSRGGQAIEITLPEEKQGIWFAGNGKGELPAVLVHTNQTGCELNTTRPGGLKQHLAARNTNGKELATALVEELRRRALLNPSCTCGVALRFPETIREH